ncbi:uro-adherence factor A [Parasteatoda tepidariorum]|uniref:uro-adherence factor A n=1 Tax=Parasteatoda tepidariorum TaxID=114398 RepID=UPI001C725D06|nr:uncharacterized protein LOC122268382 [Parasteatoda tepidariorum]
MDPDENFKGSEVKGCSNIDEQENNDEGQGENPPEEMNVEAIDDTNYVTIAVRDEDDQNGEQVYGYLDTRSATLFVQNHLEGGSPQLFLTQNEDGNEIFVVMNENGHAVLQQDVVLESVQNLRSGDGTGINCPALELGECSGENSGATGVDIKSKTDCAGEDSDISETAVWAIRDNVPGQENATEMVFIPAQSIISSQLIADNDPNHRLHLSANEPSTSNNALLLNQPPDVARSISENSVIVSKHFSDVESPSEIEERGNEEDLDNPLSVDDDTNDRLTQDSDQTGSQYSLYSGSRTIDNAVSVIHSPSSYNSLNGNGFTSLKGREFDDRKEFNHEEASHLEDSYTGNSSPEQSFHLTSDNKLLIDEDSNTMSSQTSGLDLSKDSKVRYSIPACDTQFPNEELKSVPESPVPKDRIEEDSDVSIDRISSKASSVIVAMDEESKGRIDGHDDDSTLEKDDSSNAETTEIDVSEKEMPLNEVLAHPGEKESDKDECAIEIDALSEDIFESNSEEMQRCSEEANFLYNNDPLGEKKAYNRRKRDIPSAFNQECLLPKKKFRIQPDIEQEIAEICESGNNFHNIVKGMDYDSLPSKKSQNESNGGLSSVQANVESNIVLKEIDCNYLSVKRFQNKMENGNEQDELSDSLAENAESGIMLKEIDEEHISVKNCQNEIENGDVSNEVSEELNTELSESSDTGDSTESPSVRKSSASEVPSEQNSVTQAPQVSSLQQNGEEDEIEKSVAQSNHEKVTSTPINEKRNLDVFDLSPDDTFVLPPKITYTSRKRKRSPSPEEEELNVQKINSELFSNSGEISDSSKDLSVVNSDTSEIANESEQSVQIDDDDFISPVNIKISANYTRKRKSMPPVVREVRTRSLRPRHSAASDSSEIDSQTESVSAVGKTNSENEANNEELNWGNILLSTSFRTPSDSNSSLDPKSPKRKSSAKLKKERVTKSPASKSEEQWEKFIKSSSPKKVKSIEKKIRDKVKKQVRTLCNSEKFISQFDLSSTTEIPSPPPRKRKSSKKEPVNNNKKQTPVSSSKSRRSARVDENEELSSKVSGTKFVNDKQPTTIMTASNNSPNTSNSSINSRVSSGEIKDFNCSNCSFSTNKVNNLIMHMKFCAHKEPPGRLLDYSVNDMDRRQRIRGEDGIENCRDRSKSYLSNGDSNEASCSTAREHVLEDSDDDTDKDDRLQKRFGYKEKAVVWVQIKDRYWPAVIWRFSRRKAHVFLITSSLTYEK